MLIIIYLSGRGFGIALGVCLGDLLFWNIQLDNLINRVISYTCCYKFYIKLKSMVTNVYD